MVCTIHSNPLEYTGLRGLWRRHSTKAARGLIKYSISKPRHLNLDALHEAMTSRRDFLERAALAAAVPLARSALSAFPEPRAEAPAHGFLDLVRFPDAVIVQTTSGERRLDRGPNGQWSGDNIVVTTDIHAGALRVTLSAPTTSVMRTHLRWRGRMSDVRLMLGDAWERAYGDLEWRAWIPDRVRPWYFVTHDGLRTNAYGVRTGARALCFWQVDYQGISLWADVRSGGVGVQLGARTLEVCDVVCRAGREGESAFAAIHAFCRQMCANPRIPLQPVYGSNDWYWAYGKNSAESVLTDAHHIVELSPTGGNRPFVVIDDGWQPVRGKDKAGVGTWDRGNEKFPDMHALVSDLVRAGARPGIWIRPLQAPADAPDSWRLPRDRTFLDPTVPGALHKVADDITRLRQWGFELVKHDYTTFDIFGRWGFQMGAALTKDGWTFASGPTRTTAEVIDELYATIREAAGDSLIIGCNTVSHLSAGRFEICRIGDDTSGTEWSRTRKMGVNSLAFRGAQHGAFYVADADCVGVTTAVPWSYTKQWLDLLARSGTMLFVSLAPDALGTEQRRNLKEALAVAAVPQPLGEPIDWEHAAYPSRWRLMGHQHTYDWVGADGAGPP
jgi:alpha-galactosidase